MKSMQFNVFFSAQIMKLCWKELPDQRPTFTQLKTAMQDVEASLGDYVLPQNAV